LVKPGTVAEVAVAAAVTLNDDWAAEPT